ncbi:hypothetical protein Dvina_14400 [Dactylosporangium vinaceum]|uniref:Uncharacterized protein n=1 Tax=Dactylosporangium vinaceum TaxID=53362 RepID=A0ABV5MHT1_9ACTN|nr:hypothetical protein [Dactylosporangium vinaceum]UAB99157.1 hypothetical protein Dvina_14400 [Dactylosporangium vinaceum]
MVRRLLPLLVVALCAAALLQAMRPAVYSARTGARDVFTDAYAPAAPIREQLEYIGDELGRQVPTGSRVVFADVTPEWRMRLTQLATMHGIPVVLDSADLEVRLAFDERAPHGVRVSTRKVVAG